MEALLQSHETRLQRVEDTLVSISDRLGRLEATVEDIRQQMATKSDLERHTNTMLKWMAGFVLGSMLASVTVMTFVLNNATPRQAPVVLQLPVVR